MVKKALYFLLGAAAGVVLCLTAASMLPDDDFELDDYPCDI